MTSEEIRAAIHRVGNALGRTIDEVVEALCDRPVNGCVLRCKLIELLRQADPDTHIELPKDADGEYIHIGDEVEFEYMADKKTFTVKHITYCENYGWYLGNACIEYPTSEYELYDPIYCHHYHRPTVEDVLTEYAKKLLAWHNDCDPSDSADDELALVAEYAAKLREVMQA